MKKSKITSLALAGALMLTAMLTGTLAWQAISQEALNEKMTTVNAGGRLHDDFNGTNKDIYVENYTDPLDNGTPIYARIRLDEYMEVGDDAGQKIGDSDRKATSKIQGAKIEDKTTWSTYIPDPLDPTQPKSDTDNVALHEYWTWTLGMEEGEIKYYMPTFNKDNDSLEADINGTYAGKNGMPYDDYVKYGINEANGETKTKEDTAVYDADDDSTDQSALGLNDPAFVSTQTETHEVKQTQSGTVITMEQWMGTSYNSKPGNYWVYDTDGWAYWANPIMPGEATGLLLSGIGMKKDPRVTNYYAINVVAQFASAWDWGTPEEGEEAGTGFYTDSLTSNAEVLLKTIVEAVPTITVTNVGDVTTAYVGEQVQFEAKVMVGEVEDEDAQITWMVVDENGDELTDASASGAILTNSEGEEADGTEGTETTVTTIDKTGLLTIAEDAEGQTITVIAQSAGAVGRRTLYVSSLESINITEANGTVKVLPKNAYTLNFSAEEVLAGGSGSIKMEEGDVIWTLIIKDADGKEVISEVTKIDPTTGVLSISTDLEAGMELTINATTTRGKTVYGEYCIAVESDADLVRAFVNATEEGKTVTIDDREWYVVVKTEEQALLWMTSPEETWGGKADEDGTGTGAFGENQKWEGSNAQKWLNGRFLEKVPILKAMAVPTDITTRESYNGKTWTTTTDSVFLLSEADLYGTQNSGTAQEQDYTYGGEKLEITEVMRKSSNGTKVALYSCLRSPRKAGNEVATVNSSAGYLSSCGYVNPDPGVRPALWVSLK